MTIITPFTSPAEMLADHVRWAGNVLSEVIDKGRDEGWVPGEPQGLAARSGDDWLELQRRIAVTRCEPSIAPLAWLAAKLGLAESECALLWLLVAIEYEPRVARLADALGSGGIGVSVQLAARLLGLSV